MRLSDLKKGKFVPGDSRAPMDRPPEWMDWSRFHRGRHFFKKHTAAIMLYLNCSLAAGLTLENILRPLVYNKKSDTAKKAFVRYYKTFLHVTLWHVGDVWDYPNGKAHKSVRLVRNMHRSVSDRMNKDLQGIDSDLELYVNQFDMAMVQSAFFWAIISKPESFGIVSSKEELSDYIFFWRCIGFLLGVRDEYNVCSGSYEECYTVCKEMEEEIVIPALSQPPEDFEHMAKAYVGGTNIPAMFPLMSKDALVSYVRHALGHQVPELGLLDTLRFNFIRWGVFMLRWCPGFEWLANYIFMRQYHSDLYLLQL